ncbi:MFS transporter [Paraburkholderia bannensis]|uniref:MFS transporter n=1 Tax=Paraburkholderia bannensis TaxID=765414 RepID=UPI002ABE0782|nr:MFS transporter [Paraburkholderia bannensis]
MKGSRSGAVFKVVSGNFLEMFDFIVYGFYATAIARTFFPSDSAFASLMLSFATFGAGFLMRPLGAIVLGAFIDRRGRKKGLVVTLGLMAAGTTLIACTPSYGQIGVVAPLLVLFGRLLQGFSAGVELGGVSVYLSEIATPGRKGYFVSWQSASQQVAVVIAGLLGIGLTSCLSAEQMTHWGWRVPFLFGCLIVPAIFLIRRTLEETPDFAARTRHPTASQIIQSMLQNWRLVVAGAAMVVMTTVSFYLITAYTPTFAKTQLKLSELDSFIITLFVGMSNFIWLPTMGALSDRLGRRPLLVSATLLTMLTAYPALSWLVLAPSFGHLLVIELWLSFLYSSYNGAMVVALTEVMPADVRTTGFSLAYSLATATFGGFTPVVCTYLIHLLDNRAAPGIWLSLAAMMGLAATLILFKGQRARVAEQVFSEPSES